MMPLVVTHASYPYVMTLFEILVQLGVVSDVVGKLANESCVVVLRLSGLYVSVPCNSSNHVESKTVSFSI